MDYSNAPELSKTLSQEQRQDICSHLKEYIAQMRASNHPNPGRLDPEAADGLISQDHRHMWPHFEIVSQRRYRTIFTHSNIAPRNVLINDGKFAAIVDWESAGWYPEYWEYTRWADSKYNSSRTWHDLWDGVLDPYPDELKVD